jgi:4-amino-4-deoxy-L-arabinose transferase-like glycosyltransferase
VVRNVILGSTPSSHRLGLQAVFRRIRTPWFVCLVAFLVRVLALSLVQPWPLTPGPKFWNTGFEVVNIASSIATHRGFSSPFGIQSGPTAWIPPVYPYFLAAVYMLLGLRSNLAAMAILSTQALFSALTCIPLYAIAKRAFDEDCAIFAAWGWALFPYAVLLPELFVWETALSAFLLTLLCNLCLDLPRKSSRNCITVGALWGVAALTNTTLVSLMPVFLLAPHVRRPRQIRGMPIATVVLASIVVVSPWILRNLHAFGAFVPVRDNFGEELWQGNHEGGTGRINFGFGPGDNDAEREVYRRVGEISYVRQRRIEAINFICASPTRFLRQAFYRFRYWWFAEGETGPFFTCYRLLTLISLIGIILAWRSVSRGAAFTILAAICVYPLVYYLTNVYARYRYPIEPLMMVLAGFAVSRAFALRKKETDNF